MGYPTMFYIDLELRELLKEESNRSELICNLLRTHYKAFLNSTASKEDLAIRKAQLEKNKKESSQCFEKQEKEIETIIESITKKGNMRIEEKATKELKLKINEFVMSMTAKQEKEYRQGLKENKWSSYNTYAVECLNG